MDEGAARVVVHPTAVVDASAELGPGTVVWSHACILAGAVLGKGCRVGHGAFIDRGVRVGDGVVIHNNASLYRPVEIGNEVFVGPHVVFVNDRDPRFDATRELDGVGWKIHDGATIGANVTIMSDVSLAPHCFIGAAALVTRPTVAYGLYVGSPARLVGYRCRCGQRFSLEAALPEVCPRCQRTMSA
jgi:UDP-2-acetamido-3-amino-2,3-dideoxy-glucuronate N-acetyltransferase